MNGWLKKVGISPIVWRRSYDVEGMTVGTVAAGRIGSAVLRRLKPFDVKLHYTDRHRLPKNVEEELNLTFHSELLNQWLRFVTWLLSIVPYIPKQKIFLTKHLSIK